MATTKLKIELTMSELSHILNLISENEREGWYFGDKEKYAKRSDTIKEKLHNAKK